MSRKAQQCAGNGAGMDTPGRELKAGADAGTLQGSGTVRGLEVIVKEGRSFPPLTITLSHTFTLHACANEEGFKFTA